MIAKSQNFIGLRISLDGGAFHECTFDQCHLVYSGFLPVIESGDTPLSDLPHIVGASCLKMGALGNDPCGAQYRDLA